MLSDLYINIYIRAKCMRFLLSVQRRQVGRETILDNVSNVYIYKVENSIVDDKM